MLCLLLKGRNLFPFMQRFFLNFTQAFKIVPMKRFITFAAVALLFSCQPNAVDENPTEVMGFAPVYAPGTAVNTIGMEAARPTTNPGKIYAYGNYLFQVEQNQGIHIINNTNPASAAKIAFLKVPMATEIAIKSDHLYTNNLNDLVVFNLSNTTNPQLVSRIQGAFPTIDQTHPNVSGTFFECPDPSKGIIVAWERKLIRQPKCRR